jgi:putative inorganic carbon (hco3(-)) transporter
MKKIITVTLSLTIILSPLYILRANIFIPTTFLEWLIGLSVMTVLTDFFLTKQSFKIFRTSFDPFIGLFLLAAILATATSFDKIGGLGILKAYFIEPILFYYCLIYAVKKYGDKSFILKSLFISAIWLSLLALLQKLTGSFSLAPNEIAQDRVSAVYNSANSLALFLGPVIMFLVALFMSEKRKRKLLYALLFFFFTLIMIWTKSRGGLIAELFALIVFVYAILGEHLKILRKLWFIVPLLITLTVSFFLLQTLQSYQQLPPTQAPYEGSDTLEIRYYLWAGTINLLKDHPVFGAGLDGFKTLYSQNYKLPQYPEDFQYPHNIFLTFWAEMGILGLLAFLILMVRSFQLLIRSFPRSKNFYIHASLLAALTYWIIHGVVDVPYFKNDLSLEFWLVIALIELWSTAKSS